MKKLALCLSLFLAVSVFAEDSKDQAQLRQLNWDLQVATWKNDAAWMKKNLAPEFILIDSRGNVTNLERWLKGIESIKLQPFEPTEVEVRVYGNTGIVTGRLFWKFDTATEHVEADLRYTDVWIRDADGVWKYVNAHASPVSMKREAKKG